MVSKKNFQQNGRARGVAAPYKKPFKPAGGNNFNQIMFNASQIPDNPGYMDFNNPTPPMGGGGGGGNAGPGVSNMGAQGPAATTAQKKKNNKNKPKNKQPQLQLQQQNNMGGPGGWQQKKMMQQVGGGPNKFNSGMGMGGPRGFNAMPPMGGPNRGRRMMMPPVGPGGPRGGHMGPMPPPHGFQPPMIPPMPPMGRGGHMPPMGGVQPPPMFLRRSARGGPMPPMPPPMPPMMHPRGGMPPVPFGNGAPGKIKKPKIVKKVIKGKSTIKTLKNLVNQYPIDKPWVTDDIRVEHDKKLDIENRLKGNRDDQLFAEFKTQRDKFVNMYENAREEYLKQEAAAVKSKDANKDKQTNTNKTAAKDGITNAAIPNKNIKTNALKKT